MVYNGSTMGIISDKVKQFLVSGGLPGPVFWNDKDLTGRYHSKSDLMKLVKESKRKKKNAN
jgi:hypothetical protein